MIKKKKKESFTKDFKMPYLFRDDLEMIQEIILNELKDGKYKIEFDDYECSAIDEIDKDTERSSDFHITTFSPYLSIHFEKSDARIYTSEEDLKTIGAIAKISEIISKRERKYLWYFSKASAFLALPIGMTAGNFASFLIKHYPAFSKIIAFASLLNFVVCCTWLYIGFKSDFYCFSIVEFVKRKEKSNFFTRNNDQIGLAILSAILGAVAALLFQKLF